MAENTEPLMGVSKKIYGSLDSIQDEDEPANNHEVNGDAEAPASSWPRVENILDYWYPLIFAKELKHNKPVAAQLYGEPLVIFRGQGKDEVICLQDRCAHRSTPLSIGMVKNGVVECRYHGWQFGKDGKCVRVPSMPEGKTPAGARVHAYPCTIREDMVWVWPGNPEKCSLDKGFPTPADEARDKNWRTIDTQTDRDVSYWGLIENLLDPSHLQFTHEGQQGKFIGPPDSGPYLDLHEAQIEDLPTSGSFRAKVYSTSTVKVTNFVEIFEPPVTVRLEVYMPNGWKFFQMHYCVPLAEGKTRFLFRNMRTWLKFLPDWVMNPANSLIVDQDSAILSAQKLRLDQGASRWNYPVKADSIGVKYRHWRDTTELNSKPWFKGYVGSGMSKGGGVKRGLSADLKKKERAGTEPTLPDIEDVLTACEDACDRNLCTIHDVQEDAKRLWPSAKAWQ